MLIFNVRRNVSDDTYLYDIVANHDILQAHIINLQNWQINGVYFPIRIDVVTIIKKKIIIMK